MVELQKPKLPNLEQKEKELYWIIEHDELCWAPGEKKEETKTDFIV